MRLVYLRTVKNKFLILFLSVATVLLVLVSVFACTSDHRVVVVLNNLKDNTIILKLDTNSKNEKDTIYLSEDGIGVLNYSVQYKLYGNLFEFIYFDEKGKKVKLEEWIPGKKYTNEDKIYFQHGFYFSQEETGLLVFQVGNLEYLNKDFDIEDSTFNSKVDKALSY